MNATITFSTAQQQLVARDENGKVLAAVDHDSPITAGTDSHDIARMVFDADEILSVNHDGEFIHVEIDGTVRRLTWSIVEPELTVGYVACDYTRGDRLADVPHATICATAEAAAMHDGYDGVRYVHTDGYLYVDQPE